MQKFLFDEPYYINTIYAILIFLEVLTRKLEYDTVTDLFQSCYSFYLQCFRVHTVETEPPIDESRFLTVNNFVD